MEELPINIKVDVVLVEEQSRTLVKKEIENEVKKYLLELRKTWEEEANLIVRISQIESRILNIDSVLDISNTQINAGTSNIEISLNQVPILGEVVIEE